MPRSGTITLGGQARPALLASAAWRVPLPERPLLTFGMGVDMPDVEVAGWYRLTVRADGRIVSDKTLNPRAARGWRDVSEPLSGLGRETRLELDLRLTDRDGRPLPVPAGLVLAVADPVVHDLDAYGKAKGIVLVSIDTVRRDHVGAYGYAKPTTPRLDALAKDGVLAEDAVSTSSWTLPAHLSMLTSVDPAVHGGVDMKHGYNHGPTTVASTLRAAGFATHAVTSHLYVSSVYGLDDGFESLDFHQDRKATDVANRGMDLLDRFGDRPFFLFVHLYDPHWHYDPPPEALAPFAKPYAGTLTGLWGDFSKRDRKSVTAADLEHLLALYDGEIRYADSEVGRLLDHLTARGLDKNTLVLVTSDHGEEFLEHGSWEHQKTLYEEVIRVPLVVRAPGLAPRRERAQTSLLDVAPTLLAWAGVAAPASFTGRSLLAPLAAAERETYGETDHTIDRTHKLFLRGGQGRWKSVLSLDALGKTAAEEWYDLAQDPGEHKSAPPAATAADSIRRRAVERWKQGRGARTAPCVALTVEQAEKLRALGYVEGSANATCAESASPPPVPAARPKEQR
jgi:arylsulfatase A-like enzyme